ncbi:MAG: 4Fe-4S dicluster domain-containing protein [Verrucomicrobia bacterium]|nr:4Fe-4S dicluster domain-containing protein [Verrucomicrobiota bacterium]
MAELHHNTTLDSAQFRDHHLNYQHTLYAVGYVDILAIPTPTVESIVIPKLDSLDIQALETELSGLKPDDRWDTKEDGAMMEFLLDQRAINGTAAMFIDLNRCTQCDDCIRACATTHDNNPRFIRQGPKQDGIQLTHACMHCVDPLCMIGCPTGAIQRNTVGKQVVINEYTCIGCSTCADNCPYENIQMVELRDRNGDFQPGTRLDAELGMVRVSPTEAPLLKATKCDLCETLSTGPSCVNACPHDALVRADMTDPEVIFNWIDRK